jgi:hypothetical protein
MRIGAGAAVAALAIALAACASGPRSYSNTLPKNLHVTTKVEGGSTDAAVAFDIHRVDSRCQTEHEGRINLENGATEVGLPVDAPLYLEFIFVTRGGFGSPVGATRHGMLFTARTGYDYRADVLYKKGIYSVEIREGRKGAAAGRLIERVPLSACKPRA